MTGVLPADGVIAALKSGSCLRISGVGVAPNQTYSFLPTNGQLQQCAASQKVPETKQ
jgi:hypothetical protein